MLRNAWIDSKFPLEHISDIVRIIALYKYGGLYLDTDVITLVPFKIINKQNFACIQDMSQIDNAVMHFDLENGRFLTEEYLR
jgi:mannosyltransferase OCH1-like enzyme